MLSTTALLPSTASSLLPVQRDGHAHDVQDPRLPCRENDGELWFAQEPVEVELAKTLCAQCPVRVACLRGALEREEPWGVWGGQLLMRGRVVPRKRPRGRPRKDEGLPSADGGSAPSPRASAAATDDVDAA